MIAIIQGKPGAGKTLLAVKLIEEKYYEKIEDGVYAYKPDVEVVSDIDGLILPHTQLKEVLEKMDMEPKDFFNQEIQEKIKEKKGEKKIVYVLDEAQMTFQSRFYEQEVFSYFQYHRHYGHEIWLITQDQMMMPRNIVKLAEYSYQLVNRSLSMIGEFRYMVLMNGQIADRKSFRGKKYYKLYRSAGVEAGNLKPKNPFKKYIIGVLILIALLVGNFAKNYAMLSPEDRVIKKYMEMYGITEEQARKKMGKTDVRQATEETPAKNANVFEKRKNQYNPDQNSNQPITQKIWVAAQTIEIQNGESYQIFIIDEHGEFIPIKLYQGKIRMVKGISGKQKIFIQKEVLSGNPQPRGQAGLAGQDVI